MSPSSQLPDVQSESSKPARPEVVAGIDHVRIRLELPDSRQVVAVLALVARVPLGHRGVHMSRLYRMLAPEGDLQLGQLSQRLLEVASSQETTELVATLAWEDLVSRPAPVTASSGYHPFRTEVRAVWSKGSGLRFATRVESAAMLACPCSKALSEELGFHNQRGILQAEVAGLHVDGVGRILDCIDRSASNRVHPVLRREDEKDVIDVLTRRNSFRFVEDAASLLLGALEAEGFTDLSIHVRSMESIHAHDAVAWAGPRGQELSEGIQLR